MTADTAVLDGNAGAGVLGAIFAFDATMATVRCLGCGHTGSMAEAHLYARAPGMVVRCAGCDAVLLRVVEGPDRSWLDLRGIAFLQFPRPE